MSSNNINSIWWFVLDLIENNHDAFSSKSLWFSDSIFHGLGRSDDIIFWADKRYSLAAVFKIYTLVVLRMFETLKIYTLLFK